MTDETTTSRDHSETVLAVLLAQSPDLPEVVNVWDEFSDPIRTGIPAMVKASGSRKPMK